MKLTKPASHTQQSHTELHKCGSYDTLPPLTLPPCNHSISFLFLSQNNLLVLSEPPHILSPQHRSKSNILQTKFYFLWPISCFLENRMSSDGIVFSHFAIVSIALNCITPQFNLFSFCPLKMEAQIIDLSPFDATDFLLGTIVAASHRISCVFIFIC